MVIDPVVGAVVTALWGALGTLSGLVYRELRAQIADKDKRIATLEDEARAAVKAKDEEIREWKARALDGSARSGRP